MEPKYKPGAFYWVKPVFDVDFTPPGSPDADFDTRYNHWRQQEQPARFEGYSETGEEIWIYLGVDDPHPWPVCWVGDEITKGDHR
jgi:hypothetical protein